MAKTNNVANVIFELHFSRQNKIEMITGFIKTNITMGLSWQHFQSVGGMVGGMMG